MALDDEVASARGAAQALKWSAERLSQHYGDTVDVRRLALDIDRVRDDLDLLCGLPSTRGPQRELEVMTDAPYSPELWAGAEDEGVGSSRP